MAKRVNEFPDQDLRSSILPTDTRHAPTALLSSQDVSHAWDAKVTTEEVQKRAPGVAPACQSVIPSRVQWGGGRHTRHQIDLVSKEQQTKND